jgi:hypothetical protein
MPNDPALVISRRLQCTYCNQTFYEDRPYEHTPHTDAEWEAWRVQQGIPDGEAYARRILPDAEPIPPDGPPPVELQTADNPTHRNIKAPRP